MPCSLIIFVLKCCNLKFKLSIYRFMIARKLHSFLKFHLENFPVTALLGPRQCGKSTLAKMLLATYEETIYLDLESPGDLRSLSDPELFFSANQNQLICLDEIQRVPELFATIRSHVDKSKAKGQFLILGSASEQLIRQSSESLAGRIAYLELTPFLLTELPKPEQDQIRSYWLRGGYTDSFLGNSDLLSLQECLVGHVDDH